MDKVVEQTLSDLRLLYQGKVPEEWGVGVEDVADLIPLVRRQEWFPELEDWVTTNASNEFYQNSDRLGFKEFLQGCMREVKKRYLPKR